MFLDAWLCGLMWKPVIFLQCLPTSGQEHFWNAETGATSVWEKYLLLQSKKWGNILEKYSSVTQSLCSSKYWSKLNICTMSVLSFKANNLLIPTLIPSRISDAPPLLMAWCHHKLKAPVLTLGASLSEGRTTRPFQSLYFKRSPLSSK